MRVLIDSDILIEVGRGNVAVMRLWSAFSQSEDELLYSPVTEAELWAGVRRHEVRDLQDILERLNCVPVDSQTGRRAGDYLRQYHKSHGLEVPDALIAASSVLNQALLWTRNFKHYPMPDVTFYSRPS